MGRPGIPGEHSVFTRGMFAWYSGPTRGRLAWRPLPLSAAGASGHGDSRPPPPPWQELDERRSRTNGSCSSYIRHDETRAIGTEFFATNLQTSPLRVGFAGDEISVQGDQALILVPPDCAENGGRKTHATATRRRRARAVAPLGRTPSFKTSTFVDFAPLLSLLERGGGPGAAWCHKRQRK